MTNSSNPLWQIEKKILKLEEDVKKHRKLSKSWRDKFYKARNRIENLELNTVNVSEIEHLRVENGKLQTELSNAKREVRAAQKYRKIEQIVTGGK